MGSITLSQAKELSENKLLSGVIENIVTVDKFYDVLPFMGISGNALAYNRELALGDVQTLGVGGTITAKNPATSIKVTTELTTIVGDAEVNNLVQSTLSGWTDQTQYQIFSKVKSIGRKYSDLLINGDKDGNPTEFDGLLNLLPASQTISAGDNGGALSFALLDEMLSLVKDKDGQVDFIVMNTREILALNNLYRALGGAGIMETMNLPGTGRQVPAYRGVPIFRNDYIPTNQTKGSATNASTILCGTLDDGSNKVGISGLTSENNYGISMSYIGESETKDEAIYRVRFYCGLALFSNYGIAGISGIVPAA